MSSGNATHHDAARLEGSARTVEPEPAEDGTGDRAEDTVQDTADDRADDRAEDTARDTADESPSRLDLEGDAAADYLEELLDIVDLDGDIDMFVENGRASVAVMAEGADRAALQRLVGRDGEVLEALQGLTRLAVEARTGERSRLLLDIGGWREARRAEAGKLAADAIDRARSAGEAVELDPMPAYQRKAVHDAVAAAGMRSDSDGVEPNRYVVIHPT